MLVRFTCGPTLTDHQKTVRSGCRWLALKVRCWVTFSVIKASHFMASSIQNEASSSSKCACWRQKAAMARQYKIMFISLPLYYEGYAALIADNVQYLNGRLHNEQNVRHWRTRH